MAIDNKNRNNPGANSDEDPTSELEIVRASSIYVDEEAEADANTCAFDDEHPEGRSVDALKSELKSRNEHIGQLQFDAEQLRARWTGLEKEIAAREALTRVLQQDLRDGVKHNTKQDKRIKKQQREIESLKSDLDASIARENPPKSTESLNVSSATFTDPQNTAKLPDENLGEVSGKDDDIESTLREELEQARITVSELEADIDGRKNDWARLGEKAESYKVSIIEKDEALASLEQDLSQQRQTTSAKQRKLDRLGNQINEEKAQSKQLKEKNRALTQEIDSYQANTQFNVEQCLAEQSGRLVSNKDEISQLNKQLIRSERYADELRENLKNLEIESVEYSDQYEQLNASLEMANGQIVDLEELLDAERQNNLTLTVAVEHSKEEFESEARQIRFELGAAEETIGDYETVNEQLASNLTDNTNFSQVLEEQLSSAAEKHTLEKGELENRASTLERQIEDAQRTILDKDKAISALLNELASKSHAIESKGDIGNVISEIDDRTSKRIEEPNNPDRERPTRLLIGIIDGQELQFPLFKERLTIGRTLQNDIQLNSQHISRRHAIILNDEDGPRVIDWASKNGVYVNNEKVTEQRLCKGDKVKIGTAEFIFEEHQKR